MKETKHFISRLSQRSLSRSLVELVCWFGKRDNRNRIILNMKDIDEQLLEVERLKQNLLKARKKGSVYVVEDNGVLITAYFGGRNNGFGRRGK